MFTRPLRVAARGSGTCLVRKAATLAAVTVLSSAPARAADVVQTFYVPFPENDSRMMLMSIDNFAGNIGSEIRSVVSLVISTPDTRVYYDHWEDGYEQDITSPTQATTEVWGDAIEPNGIPPGFIEDILLAGSVISLEDTVDVPRNALDSEYDGTDKLAATKPVSMTRALYALEPGEVLADSAPVFDTSMWGTLYRAPVGIDTAAGDPNPNTPLMFEYSAFFVLAAYDFTRVEIDKDNDGVVDIVARLNEGGTYHVNGGVKAGATVRATKPVSCYMATGDIGSNYEMRWFELWSQDKWDSDYYTAISGYKNASGYGGSFVFVFNPNTNGLTVTYQTAAATGTFSVAAGSVSAPFGMPTNSGARFHNTNGLPFIAVQTYDTNSTMQAYDWGCGLPPARTLTTVSICGWGPGRGVTASGTNAQPVWVMAVSNTTLYVDRDSSPYTGTIFDPFGNLCDSTTNLTAYQVARLYDDADEDQTGMKVYTADGTYIVTAWGEDPARAGTGNPYLDMGYCVLPFPSVYARKYATLLIDKNTNGVADPGDSYRFIITVANVGFASAQNVVLEDGGVTNICQYATNSTAVNGAPVADNAVPPKLTPFPLDEGGLNIGTIAVGATSVVTYVSDVVLPFPSNASPYAYNGASVIESNGQWITLGFTNVSLEGLTITKEPSTTNLLDPGDFLSYTVRVSNTGEIAFTEIALEDLLPRSADYVSGSATVRYPGALTNSVEDWFNDRFFTQNNGTRDWTAGWTELGESDGALVGRVAVTQDLGAARIEFFALCIAGDGAAGSTNGAARQADLAGYTGAELRFKYRRAGLDDTNDYVAVWSSGNGGASWTELGRIRGPATDAAYAATNYNLSAFIASNTAIRFVSSPAGTMGAGDSVWFDDVKLVFSGTNVVVAGSDPPALFQGYALTPGTSIVATLTVQVTDPPTALDLVNTARVRAQEHEGWIYPTNVTNYINTTLGLRFTKTSSPTNPVQQGDPVTYTLTLQNTGGVQITGIRLDDALPPDVAYVPGSARLWRPFAYTNTWGDHFNTRAYTNSDGPFRWTTSWQETNDANASATGGIVRVANDGGALPGHVYALRVGSTGGVSRTLDLSGCTNAQISVEYRRQNFGAGDYVSVHASSNGVSWTELGQIGSAVAVTDIDYRSTNYSLSAYISTGTTVRFLGHLLSGGSAYGWFDTLTVTASGRNGTNRVDDPPTFFSGLLLPPQTSMVVTLSATVSNPPVATQLVNAAALTTDQLPVLYAYATNTVQTHDVGSYVWYDQNTNGVQDAWEGGVTNVTVRLYDSASNLLFTGYTDAGGNALFTNLLGGDYFLEFLAPSGHIVTVQDQGGDDTVDSDAAPATGRTAVFSLSGGTNDYSRDAGLYLPPSSVSGLAWYDADTNGLQGVGETGASNVTVYLYDANTQLVKSAVTDAAGNYSFTNLFSGGYLVGFAAPPDCTFTLPDQGADDALDSDVSKVTGRTPAFFLPAGTNLDWDAGLVLAAYGIGLTKTPAPTGFVNGADTITYTIIAVNTGTTAHAVTTVSDTLPPGLTYVTNSTEVVSWGWQTNISTNVTTNVTQNTVRDEFNARAYTNNNGTVNWDNNWQEANDDGSATAGEVQVLQDGTNQYVLRIRNRNRAAARRVNLGGASEAVISFVYRPENLGNPAEAVALRASDDGGTTWTSLYSFQGSSAAYAVTNFDLSSYIATNTVIEFRGADQFQMGNDDSLYVDDVQISITNKTFTTNFTTNVVYGAITNAGGPPPTLATGYLLETGKTLRVTFRATVDSPPAVTQLVNTAYVTSATHPPISATATNPVPVTDLAVFKSVNEPYPGFEELIWYTLVITNHGPANATGVRVTDYWPTNVLFSNAVPSQGSYDSTGHVWNVGSLATGSYATLVITGRMNTAYHLVGVTNRIAITALNQYDTNMANNTNQAAVLTRVLLTRFEASAAGGTVVLEWETASEEATAGFYLLRLTEAGDWVKVGGGLLPSLPDSPQGGVYRLLDGGADPAAALTYELVEIEAGGVERSCGRFIVRPSGPAPSRSGARTAAALQEAGGYTAEPRIQAPAAARASAAAETPVCPAPAAAASRAKLRVRETALYFVDGASVAAALGLTAEEAAARIQAGGLALRIRTDAVAYLPASGGSGFYFWGTAPESLSAPENVYWMEEGPGLLMATAEGDGPLPGPRATFAETLHVEQNRYALTGLFTDPEADYWTWDSLVAGNPTAGSKRFALHVPGVAAVEHVATLVVHLQGVTATGRKDEHHVQVRLNGRLVGDGRWTGAAATAFPFAIDQRGFVSGDNTVELTAVLDAGVPHSVFHLQAFDLSYRRRCEAEQDRVRLRTDGPAVVSVSGFGTPAIRVFDLSDPLRPVHVAAITVDEAMDSYRVSFVSAGTGVPYAAVGSAAVQSPLGIAADAPSALREPGAADYVIIAPPALAAAAGALADHRAAGGYRARVVDLEDIYDEFSGGLAEPAAIREFLAWAAGHWSVPPRYVVLAGDGTFDYRGHKGYADNLLPAIMVGTPQGLFAWDGAYADVDRDGLADMAVGRLPADTPSQLQALVAGIVSYESRAPSDWPARVLLAADNDDGGGSFRAAGEAVRGRLPPKWDTRRAYLDEWRIEECRNGLFAALAEGVQFFAYFGHAGIDRLAAEGLLLGAESAALDNGGWPPILTAMTCVMGQFSVPGFDCLGETLLLAPRGGVAAVWAPSGMSLNEPAAALCAEVYTAVFERGQAVLGDAIRAALAAYAEGAQARYLGHIYNLLGDPALQAAGTRLWIGFEGWRRAQFDAAQLADPDVSADAADPDKDGVPNLLEYAFGLSPWTPSGRPVLLLSEAGAEAERYDLVVTFTRRRAAPDLTYRLEVAADCPGAWLAAAGFVSEDAVTDDGNGVTETVRCYLRSPAPDRSRGFVRLRLEKRP